VNAEHTHQAIVEEIIGHGCRRPLRTPLEVVVEVVVEVVAAVAAEEVEMMQLMVQECYAQHHTLL
tara:strand:- start:11220 stop:11414 length:195 start_codon:yes stop_codon:yes gene_type:complete